MFAFLNRAKKDVEDAAGATVHAAAKAGKKTLNFIASSPQDNHSKLAPVIKGVADSVVVNPAHAVYDMGRGAVGSATGNDVAVTNANKAKAVDYPKVLNAPARVLVQTARTIEHPLTSSTFQAHSPEAQEIIGKEPVQNIAAGVKSNYAEHKNPFVAALYGGGQVAQDAATLAGGKVGAENIAGTAVKAGKTAAADTKKVVKALDDHGTQVAAKHPAVQALDQHMQQLTQHREQLLKSGASEVAIKANDNAYKSSLKARDDTIKSIKEGGFVQLPGGAKDDVVKKVFDKQSDDNSLYHGTESENAISILKDGKLKATQPKGGEKGYGSFVSFSRQKNAGFKSNVNTGVRFVADNDKVVGNVGKTKPFVDGLLGPNEPHKADAFEAEQRINKDVPLTNIKRIEINPSQMTHDEETQIRQLAKKQGIPVVSNSNTDEMRSVVAPSTGSRAFVDALGADRSKELDDMEASGGKLAASENTTPAAETLPTPKPGYTPSKSGAQVLNESLPSKARVSDKVARLLDDTGKAVPKASKAPILESQQDPTSVAGKLLGKTGSDIIYESSKGAKKASDINEAAKPYLDAVKKATKNLSKTPGGQPAARRRLNQALNDRENAASYLKSPEETKAYEALRDAYDHTKGVLEANGFPTRANYAPRLQRRDIEASVEDIDKGLGKTFSKNVSASATKERTAEEGENLAEDPVAALGSHVSSIAKHIGYKDLVDSLPERLKGVKPIYGVNADDLKRGKQFLSDHFKNILQPDLPTTGKLGEQAQNKLINQTYRSALKGKISFYGLNRTQRFAARSQVSPEAIRLSKHIDKNDLKDLQSELTSGKSTLTTESNTTTSSVEGKQTKTDKLHEKLSGEQGNVIRAYNLGVSQHIANSPAYKAAIKAGKNAKDAAKEALTDPAIHDGAVRDGNTLVNTTQFGANIATKPHALQESGVIPGTIISKKWIQQYRRFPQGMLQIVGNVTDPKTARALDIMRRGDPKQTQLVEYLNAAKSLRQGISSAKTTIKKGENTEVSLKDIAQAKDLLDQNIKILNKQIKKSSSIRGGKTARNLALMWGSAYAIQSLATGGTNPFTTAVYSSPVSIPTKDSNPLVPSAPSIPTSKYSKLPLGISPKKALNFVPFVGPVAARITEAQRFTKALTGATK